MQIESLHQFYLRIFKIIVFKNLSITILKNYQPKSESFLMWK